MAKLLDIGRYTIPEGCTYEAFGKELIIRRNKRMKLEDSHQRCMDCKYLVEGNANPYKTKIKSLVCLKHPKFPNSDDKKDIYYARTKYNIVCSLFEPKE